MLKEMKQLKTNNLEGGMWPFSYFFGSSETSQQVADSTDGTYLVFYIDEEKINTFKEEYEKNKSDEFLITKNNKELWNYFETVKNFTQNSYDDEEKTGIKFFNKNKFKDLFDKKAYILIKNGKNITSTIISTDNDNNFNNDIKNIETYINKINDLITKNTSMELNCHTTAINNIQENIKDMKIDNTEYNHNLVKYIESLSSSQMNISNNENKTKEEILEILNNLKKNYTSVLETMNKSIYASMFYESSQISWKDVSVELILEEINIKGMKKIDNNEKIKPNMIIKINNDDPVEYKYAETIKKNSISITNMYTLLNLLIASRRHTRTLKDTKIHLGSAS